MTDDRTRTLVHAATEGDEVALNALVGTCLPRLHAFVRLRMGPELRAREGSLDVVQSVCREALDGLQSGFEYRGERPFLSWLFQAALNKLRKRHRESHRQMRDVGREEHGFDGLADSYASLHSPSQEAIGREEVVRLEAAFDALPDDYREVVTLSRIVGLSHEEIATEMGRTTESVRRLLGRALARLAQVHRADGAS